MTALCLEWSATATSFKILLMSKHLTSSCTSTRKRSFLKTFFRASRSAFVPLRGYFCIPEAGRKFLLLIIIATPRGVISILYILPTSAGVALTTLSPANPLGLDPNPHLASAWSPEKQKGEGEGLSLFIASCLEVDFQVFLLWYYQRQLEFCTLPKLDLSEETWRCEHSNKSSQQCAGSVYFSAEESSYYLYFLKFIMRERVKNV